MMTPDGCDNEYWVLPHFACYQDREVLSKPLNMLRILSQVALLVDQINGPIVRVTADGAHDGARTYEMRDLARHVRNVMPDVKVAYSHANVEIGKGGLLLRPSKPSVPKTQVNGYRTVDGSGDR